MGQPLDETRESRFPSRPPESVRSQQMNFRELEDAILWLQSQNSSLNATVLAQDTLISELKARIDILEASQD